MSCGAAAADVARIAREQLPLSLEVRSKRYRETYPDPVRAVRAATRRFLACA